MGVPDRPIDVLFMLDEAYSLFPGGTTDVPLGGAGTTEYYLADALSEDPNFRVTWLFSSEVDISPLSHPRIRIESPRKLIRRGVPIVSRWINRARTRAPLAHMDSAVMIAPPWRLPHPSFQLGSQMGFRSIVRIASDLNVIDDGSGSCIAAQIRNGCCGDNPTIDAIAFQSEHQQDLMGHCGSCLQRVMGKGWPIPDVVDTGGLREYFLWIGSCRPVKQPWVLLELAESLPDLQFVMLMPLNQDHYWELGEEIAERAQHIPNLELITEQMPIEETGPLFSGALAFINTSESEGFPSTFLQAGVAGVPIISLHVDPDGMISNHGLGAVCGGSTQALHDAIQAYSDPASRGYTAASQAVWDYVRRNHDVRDSVEAYKQLIRDVVARTP